MRPMTEPAPQEIDRIGEELDAVRRRVVADLGVADAEYIRKVVAAQRLCEVSGRVLLFAGWFPPAWLGGVAALAVSTFEWDMVCPGEQWRRSHNFMHHTYTNILEKDRDVGYGILRISEDQRWHPYYLGNPLYAAAQAVFFEYGIMLHDLEVDRIVRGRRTWADVRPLAAPMLRKTARQAAKDYVVFPVLTGPLAPLTLTANAGANLVRNLWAFAVIFCGRLRQMLGSANRICLRAAIRGSPRKCAKSANGTTCRTTRGACPTSSARFSGRSSGWLCPGHAVTSRGRVPETHPRWRS